VKKYAFLIDVAKCENCNNCFLSCKDEHCGNDWPGYSASQPLHGQRWMNIFKKERGSFPMVDVAYLPKPCMHCDDAPCIEASSNEGVYKRPDGIVLIDPVKAKGQKELVSACPYGAIWWNEELQLPQKCTLCAHLLDKGWSVPRCVQVCPTGALTIKHVEDEKLQSLVKSENYKRLDVERSSGKPRVYYKNLHRYNRCMVAGSVATGKGDITECVIEATVYLRREGETVAEIVTDDFGDFKFDGIEAQSGSYELEIVSEGERFIHPIDTVVESKNVGTFWI